MRALAVMVWLSAIVAADAHAVPCRVVPPKPAVLTPAHVTIGDDGGIVVANRASDWELLEATAGPATLAPKRIAPGLDVIPLPANGSYELRDDTSVLVHVTRGKAKAKPLPAPKPAKLALVTPNQRGGDTVLTAMFSAPPPAGAVALVVLAKGKARSWGRVGTGTSIVVYQGVCQTTPPKGTVASRAGEAVTLAWLDDTGQLSPASAAVRIR